MGRGIRRITCEFQHREGLDCTQIRCKYQVTPASALLGTTRSAVLALLYGHPDESFHMRQIARVVGHGQGAVQRELRRLSASGLLLRSVRGRQVHYQANRDCPIFAELQRLLLKTAGLADVLRSALAGLSDRIQVAFVYGSLARGVFDSGSDVDVLVVGAASFAQVVSALGPAQEALGREVNPSVYSSAEFHSRLLNEDHFLTSVLAEPKILLVGDEGDLHHGGRPWSDQPIGPVPQETQHQRL